jgi:hypothetical protein
LADPAEGVSEYDIGEQVLPAPWFVDNVHTYSILNQIFRPIQRFPQSLKSVRIIAFAFFLDGGVSEAAYRGAQTFDRLVTNPEGFRQGMLQGFALGIEGLLGRGRNCKVSGVGETKRSLCKTFQARNRLCFDDSNSSSKSWIAFGVIAIP